VIVRAARPDEADVLTALALRSKASWGYSDAFMDACRAELTLTPEKMAAWRIWVAEEAGAIAGMVALQLDGAKAELEDLFVDPAFQQMGVGAALLDVLVAACRDAGARAVGLDADPNAESIYARLGFHTVGCSPSGSIPGRMLPRMELRL
jgi:N-acetylglutamate synthase-like GNAT family acetyltransferase